MSLSEEESLVQELKGRAFAPSWGGCSSARGALAPGPLSVSCGQSIGASASASVLAMSILSWFSLGLFGLISLQSTGLSRVFSSTTVQINICWLNTFPWGCFFPLQVSSISCPPITPHPQLSVQSLVPQYRLRIGQVTLFNTCASLPQHLPGFSRNVYICVCNYLIHTFSLTGDCCSMRAWIVLLVFTVVFLVLAYFPAYNGRTVTTRGRSNNFSIPRGFTSCSPGRYRVY